MTEQEVLQMTPMDRKRLLNERELEMRSLVKKFAAILEEDRVDYAKEIVDKLYANFKRGKAWLDRMADSAKTKGYVYSPIGRIRHLYAAFVDDERIVAQQVRRGMNAPIQGFASEVGIKAAYRIMDSYYQRYDVPIKMNRMVHDANYFSIPFEVVLPFIHILQYESTYGIAQAYEREFGVKFTVEPEIEIEVGCRDSNTQKWDWSLPQLFTHIKTVVKQGCEEGLYTEKYENIINTILDGWEPSLDKEFPLLGVSLKKEIQDELSKQRL